MVLLIRRRAIWAAVLLLTVTMAAAVISSTIQVPVSADNFKYRVYVTGVGPVEGRWGGRTGIAVIGVKTLPALSESNELKTVDLLIANSSSSDLIFDPDITLINHLGQRFGLKGKGQPEVLIKPGSLSHGTVQIEVPKGISDDKWALEIKGGHLSKGVCLPLKVVKTINDNPAHKTPSPNKN